MDNYRITVIIGIYNCATTLEEALESLESQTYKNFKVILCDDGSNDNTFEVAQKWIQKHNNYTLIRNEKNIKLAATLNKCLKYVDTEYVARMDGDDISLPYRFEKEINFLDQNPQFSFVSCPMAYFDEDGIYRYGKVKQFPTNNDFKNGAPFCHAPSMIRKTALDAINGYTVEKRVERAEDYYMWYKMYKAGFKGANLQEILYHMRNDKNAFKRRKFRDRLRGYYLNYEVCHNLGVRHARIIALKNLMKGFVPARIALFIRKKINL